MILAGIQALTEQANTLFQSWGYFGLFLSAFLAGTIVPFPSEVVFAFCIVHLNPLACILVATAGNSLGGYTLYLMGWLGKLEWLARYGNISQAKVRKVTHKARRWGPPLALLAFLPVVGNVIGISLGLLRCPFSATAVFMTLGKSIRYIAVAAAMLGIINI